MFVSFYHFQINYSAGDNGNQQLLESIGDSNSSSSFDMERRSFSSNSNQSTLGNYNSDHSTAFSMSSQQLNGTTNSLPSVLSSMSSAVTGNVSTLSFTYSDSINPTHRKPSNAIPFAPSPDDRSNNASQIGDLYNSSTLSAMQSSSQNTTANHMNNTGLNSTATLASLGDYSMQMNDLMNDDNGDGLDMTFWENFDNFNYEADLVMSNNSNSSTQQYPQSQNKANSKRAHDGSSSERKRKRANELLKDSSNHSKSSIKDSTKGVSALSSDTTQPLLKPNSILSQTKKSGATLVPHSILIDSSAPKSEVICIEDDEDDATNNNIGMFFNFIEINLFFSLSLSSNHKIINCVFNFTDATVNRNSDKENGTIYPVTPTKELGSDFSTKHHVCLIIACFFFINFIPNL